LENLAQGCHKAASKMSNCGNTVEAEITVDTRSLSDEAYNTTKEIFCSERNMEQSQH